MKKLLRPLLLILLGVALLGFNLRPRYKAPITFEQRVSHKVMFRTNDGHFQGQCTATAIGPHAILTATHCIESKPPIVWIDMSRHDYRIQAGISDDRDHVILLLDGPAFKNYLSAERLEKSSPARVGERLRIYGNGGGGYPARELDGKIAVRDQIADVSDVDAAQGGVWLTLQIISGDSGSAIYGQDGRVVGLVTYRIEGSDESHCMGFALGFSNKAYELANIFSVDLLRDGPGPAL